LPTNPTKYQFSKKPYFLMEIVSEKQFEYIVKRLCYELIENYGDFSNTILVGIQPRGSFLLNRLIKELQHITNQEAPANGVLDITFFRDDFRRRDETLIPSQTKMEHVVENKKVILVDDVLYTGRTIRSAMDAILAFGRPAKVELLVLIDRRFSRDLPIEPNYVGKAVDTIVSQRVGVEWEQENGKDRVLLFNQEN
jgi:pyrimidine operon attenuation protein / uracil phosphoribosyltransferase